MSDIQNNRPLLTPKQVAEKGEQIYQEKLKPILELKEKGKFVTIEVNSGEYFLGDSLLEALHLSWVPPFSKTGSLLTLISAKKGGTFLCSQSFPYLSYPWIRVV